MLGVHTHASEDLAIAEAVELEGCHTGNAPLENHAF
jgi:hypothetical protein